MSYPSSGGGIRTWHVVVFLGLAVLVADIVSIQMLGTKTDQFAYVTSAPAPVQPAPQPQPPAVVVTETVEVLVAAKDLPVGTVLNADEKLWTVAPVAKETLPAGAVVKGTNLSDKLLTRGVRAGEVLLATDLTGRGLQLPAGTRAVTLSVSARNAAGGFVVPGSKVDVTATLRTGDTANAFTAVVNVLVVAIDTDGPAKDPRYSVTFAVTEKESQVLELATTRKCDFDLLLRRADKDGGGHDLDTVLKLLKDAKP